MIGGAIGQAFALASDSDPPPHKRERPEGKVVIVLCAEQGFAGTFNDRVFDTAARHLQSDAAELLIVGNRGTMVALARGLAWSWSAPMIAHAEEAPRLASQITDALYSRLEKNQARRVTGIHTPSPAAAPVAIRGPTL